MLFALLLALQLDAPAPVAPTNNTVVGEGIKTAQLEWSPIAGAESYSLELDTFGACDKAKWCSEVQKLTPLTDLKQTNAEVPLRNSDRFRWRVWAVSGGSPGRAGTWQYFHVITGSLPVGAVPDAPYQGPVFDIKQDGLTPMKPFRRKEPDGKWGNGEVVLKLIVAPDGTVHNLRIDQPSGNGGMNAAAFDAVRQWRFEPAKEHGKPVAAWCMVHMSFRRF